MKNFTFLIFLLCVSLGAQNTLSWNQGNTAPKATLADVSWMAGHWTGEAFGGITEEIWSPPLGDSMMFIFRLITDNKVQFYEMGHIQHVGETLILRIKHFHGNLEGWEEKDEVVDFKLVKIEADAIYFDDLTFQKISEDEINIYVVLFDENGTKEEVQFHYKRTG